eukprot:241885-Prymnesium_polylepis.1
MTFALPIRPSRTAAMVDEGQLDRPEDARVHLVVAVGASLLVRVELGGLSSRPMQEAIVQKARESPHHDGQAQLHRPTGCMPHQAGECGNDEPLPRHPLAKVIRMAACCAKRVESTFMTCADGIRRRRGAGCCSQGGSAGNSNRSRFHDSRVFLTGSPKAVLPSRVRWMAEHRRGCHLAPFQRLDEEGFLRVGHALPDPGAQPDRVARPFDRVHILCGVEAAKDDRAREHGNVGKGLLQHVVEHLEWPEILGHGVLCDESVLRVHVTREIFAPAIRVEENERAEAHPATVQQHAAAHEPATKPKACTIQ